MRIIYYYFTRKWSRRVPLYWITITRQNISVFYPTLLYPRNLPQVRDTIRRHDLKLRQSSWSTRQGDTSYFDTKLTNSGALFPGTSISYLMMTRQARKRTKTAWQSKSHFFVPLIFLSVFDHRPSSSNSSVCDYRLPACRILYSGLTIKDEPSISVFVFTRHCQINSKRTWLWLHFT